MSPAVDEDARLLVPDGWVKAAAGFQVACGLYVSLAALQVVLSVVFFGDLVWLQWLNVSLLGIGAAQIVLGVRTLRLSLPVSALATAVSMVMAVVVMGWSAANLWFGMFSLVQLLALVFAVGAALLTPWTLPAARRASQARARLVAQGLDPGL